MNLDKIEEENSCELKYLNGSGAESDNSDFVSCSTSERNGEDKGGKRIKLSIDGHDASERSESVALDRSNLSTASQQSNTQIDIRKMCYSEQPAESTRMSTESNSTFNNKSIDQTYLNSSSFKTIIFDDDRETSEVSIISKVVNLIFTTYWELQKISSNGTNLTIDDLHGTDEALIRAVCCMKTVKDLTSTLCSVHEAVGLNDLKVLSYAFNDEVNDTWIYLKSLVMQTSKSFPSVNYRQKILRLLELVGGLSLAAVDNIIIGKDNLYVNEHFKGELSIYFLKHQNRFLTTMLDEANCTVEKGIEEMKKLQLSSTHEMSEDLVDGVMNILTSLGTLFQQCQDLSLVYVKSIEQCSGLCFAEECYHLRNVLTDIIDYNENIATLIEKSKLVAKNCDALEDFVDVPIVLADITKCICNTAGALLSFIASHKHLDEIMIDALYESLEKFVFAGKTVRVGVSMLVQEVEKDLNVTEDCSIVPFVNADSSFGKRGSLCPMNTSEIDLNSLDTQLKSRLGKSKRSSVARSEHYVSRYMDLNDQ